MLLLLFLIKISYCFKLLDENYLFSDVFIQQINNIDNITWTAGRNFQSIPNVKHLMGVLAGSEKFLPAARSYYDRSQFQLPVKFDAREKWFNCPTIGEIRDQGACGSCWANSAAETMSDRICIHSNGNKVFRVSAVNILACCSYCGFGCRGGIPIRAWDYYINEGVVSGGSYESHSGCQPYVFQPCEHNMNGTRPPCGDYQNTPTCHKQCTNTKFNLSYQNDLEYGDTVYSIVNDPEQIQIEIITNGPVQTTMMVYEDFLHYKSGVYHHVYGERMSEHVIKIIGWGLENDTIPYWLVANSWNTDWGDHGFVKMLRGANECGMELQVIGGIPKINS